MPCVPSPPCQSLDLNSRASWSSCLRHLHYVCVCIYIYVCMCIYVHSELYLLLRKRDKYREQHDITKIRQTNAMLLDSKKWASGIRKAVGSSYAHVARWTWSAELAIKPSLTRLYFTHRHATLFLFVARVRLELNYVHSNLKQTKSVRKNTQRKRRHGSRLWMGRCECTYRRVGKDAEANGTGVITRKGEGIAHWSRACFVISLSKEAIAENKRRMHASHACMHVCTQLRWPCTLLIITNDLISFHVCTSLTYSRDVCASY